MLFALLASASVSVASWRNHRLNASHTSFLADETFDPADLALVWERYVGNRYGSYWSIPAVARNMIYLNSRTDRGVFLEARSLKSGELIWETPVTGWYLPLGPVLAGAQVIVSLNQPARLGGYDARTGEPLWMSEQAGTAHTASIPVVAGNHAYVTANGRVHAFSLKDGTEMWSRSVAGNGSTPAVSDDGMLFVSHPGHQFALDAVTGAYLWHVHSYVSGGGGATPTIGNLVYMADRDWDDLVTPYAPMIQAFEPATGPVIWRRSFQIRDISELALAEGVLYFTDRSQLRAIDAYTGEDSWVLNVGDPLWYPPVVAGEYLFAGSVTRTYAVHIPTRSVVWQAPVGGHLVVSDGWLLISCSDGTIRAYHATTE